MNGVVAPLQVRALIKSDPRSSFCSTSDALNRYLHEIVMQDIRRRMTACYVAVTEDGVIAGYYTLASASVPLIALPETTRRKLPRYPSVPAVLMGRLAVDQNFQGLGIGSSLLADALLRAKHAEITAFALIVDSKDDKAACVYHHHGFISLQDSPLTLFLPLATVPD